MYNSPIEMIIGNMRMQQEGEIFRAVQNIGVNVDKDELLKALQYDRGQYEKGYEDGIKNGIKEFAENFKLKADKESVRELVNYGNYWGRTMKIPEDSKAYAISYKISEVDLDDLVKEMTEG